MIGKYDRNNAEELFKDNINEEILVELCTGLVFKGKLLAINCNTFITETKEGLKEMFRYEDMRYLQCRECLVSNKDNTKDDNIDKDVYAKDIDDCENCPLYQKDCVGGWTSGGGGTPIEPPCTSWNDDDLIWEGMYDN